MSANMLFFLFSWKKMTCIECRSLTEVIAETQIYLILIQLFLFLACVVISRIHS